ncbi:hypothetical protein VUR80DRAFT_7086 [Thermomyces stellatus]
MECARSAKLWCDVPVLGKPNQPPECQRQRAGKCRSKRRSDFALDSPTASTARHGPPNVLMATRRTTAYRTDDARGMLCNSARTCTNPRTEIRGSFRRVAGTACWGETGPLRTEKPASTPSCWSAATLAHDTRCMDEEAPTWLESPSTSFAPDTRAICTYSFLLYFSIVSLAICTWRLCTALLSHRSAPWALLVHTTSHLYRTSRQGILIKKKHNFPRDPVNQAVHIPTETNGNIKKQATGARAPSR